MNMTSKMKTTQKINIPTNENVLKSESSLKIEDSTKKLPYPLEKIFNKFRNWERGRHRADTIGQYLISFPSDKMGQNFDSYW